MGCGASDFGIETLGRLGLLVWGFSVLALLGAGGCPRRSGHSSEWWRDETVLVDGGGGAGVAVPLVLLVPVVAAVAAVAAAAEVVAVSSAEC